MERLARLSHRVIWLNPHHRGGAGGRRGPATAGPDRQAGRGSQDAPPASLGMLVAEPHIDLLLSGHDLRSLEQFAAMLPEVG